MFIVRWASGVTRISERAVAPTSFRGVDQEVDALRLDVMLVDLAQLVVGDLADERGLEAQRGKPRRGVAGRAAADLPARPHRVVKAHRLRLVDQPHRPLVKPLLGQEGVVGVGDDIDDRVADAEHVVAGLGHESRGSCGKLEFAARLAAAAAGGKLATR